MKLYRTTEGAVVEEQGRFYGVGAEDWDSLLADEGLLERVRESVREDGRTELDASKVLAPVGPRQEVWAAGVTYYRSRSARIEESKDAGGGTFYDRVYGAERPELFFKSTGERVMGPGERVRIRRDATWSVPEPELTLLVSPGGKIVGYTIGNDMSSRDIEGENPLYLPQAKMYDGSCAVGPCILLSAEPMEAATAISIEIVRGGAVVFEGRTTLAELKRDPQELVGYLFREMSFPRAVFLMTGTGVVPEDSFTLAGGDVIRISIAGIGVLENVVG